MTRNNSEFVEAGAEVSAAPAIAVHSHSCQPGTCTRCRGSRLVYFGQGEYGECNECVDKDASPHVAQGMTDKQILELVAERFGIEGDDRSLFGTGELISFARAIIKQATH